MKQSITIQALVTEGKTALSDGQREKIFTFLRDREGKYVTISMRDVGKPRSLNQNNYLWGIVYQYISDETGHSTEDIHEFCKMKFLPRSFVTIGNEEFCVTKSTTKLSTDEMEEYLNQVRAFAAQELSVAIPLPNESLTPSPLN